MKLFYSAPLPPPQAQVSSLGKVSPSSQSVLDVRASGVVYHVLLRTQHAVLHHTSPRFLTTERCSWPCDGQVVGVSSRK